MAGTGTGARITGSGGGTGTLTPKPALPPIDAIFSNALKDIFNSPMGEDATFTPASGVAVTGLRVIVNRSVLLQPAGMDAQVYERGTTIEVILADVGAEPNRGEIFVVNPGTSGAETFTVQSIDSNDGQTVVMVVT